MQSDEKVHDDNRMSSNFKIKKKVWEEFELQKVSWRSSNFKKRVWEVRASFWSYTSKREFEECYIFWLILTSKIISLRSSNFKKEGLRSSNFKKRV